MVTHTENPPDIHYFKHKLGCCFFLPVHLFLLGTLPEILINIIVSLLALQLYERLCYYLKAFQYVLAQDRSFDLALWDQVRGFKSTAIQPSFCGFRGGNLKLKTVLNIHRGNSLFVRTSQNPLDILLWPDSNWLFSFPIIYFKIQQQLLQGWTLRCRFTLHKIWQKTQTKPLVNENTDLVLNYYAAAFGASLQKGSTLEVVSLHRRVKTLSAMQTECQ